MPKTKKAETEKIENVEVGSITIPVIDVTKWLLLRQSWLTGTVKIQGKDVDMALDIEMASGSLVIKFGNKRYMVRAKDVLQAVCNIHVNNK